MSWASRMYSDERLVRGRLDGAKLASKLLASSHVLAESGNGIASL